MSNAIPPIPSLKTGKHDIRLPDTAQNRDRLRQEASKDGKPSILAKQGNDLLLLSGAHRTESKIARQSADEAISKGDALKVDGKKAEVLHTDDGFTEVDLSKVTVAVIDSGVDVTHPAFSQSEILPGFNAKSKTEDVGAFFSHGTHVAGIIAGSLPEEGVHGVAPGATLLPIKFGTSTIYNTGLFTRVADSVRHAVDNGAQVINISMGTQTNNWILGSLHAKGIRNLEEALDYAEAKGVVVVVAAGNNRHGDKDKDNVNFPATHPTVIAVSNLDDTSPEEGLKLSPNSSIGPAVDLAAPGMNIVSAVKKGKVDEMSGTSMAAPYVAGVVAQIIARHPDWTPAQIRDHLAETSQDLGKPGKDIRFGHGAVDPVKAVFGE
jgi:subtilisin family serine protease